jgi:enamine deaminase RidA (YjgF/YER057c/UK114 family)
MTPEEKISAKGLTLPPSPKPIANYVRTVRSGNMVYVAGTGPDREGGPQWHGKLGENLKIEDGYQAAQACALNMLASLKVEIGELSYVRRIVKLLGMVNASPAFTEHPKVINGASDLLVEIFGEQGRHARSAVGMGSLPNSIPVEIEMIVEVDESELYREEEA